MRPALVSLLLLTACPNSGGQSPCTANNCRGCCTAQGVCELGQSSSACGASGDLCVRCGTGLSCSMGACEPSAAGGGSSGTGGGSSGTGGGASGAGGGFIVTGTNELISGTRLRAINLIGADGSKMPYTYEGISYNIFWDTQLNTYCAKFYPTIEVCYPIVHATDRLSLSYFSDPGCTNRNAFLGFTLFNDIFVDAGLASGAMFFALSDGGLATATAAGTAFDRTSLDGGCVAVGTAYIPGTPVPMTSLVRFTVMRD